MKDKEINFTKEEYTTKELAYLVNKNYQQIFRSIEKGRLRANKYPLAVVMDSIFNNENSKISTGTLSDLVKTEFNGKRRWSI